MELQVISLFVTLFLVSSVEFITFVASSKDPNDGLELMFVSVVFRHGDRAPDNNGNELYPNDPYKNYSFYPDGFGGLSVRGKKREYQLGQALRRDYRNFLGEFYSPGLVKGMSTDYDRTKMSLMVVLCALLPPMGDQIWNSKIHWQPIPTSYFLVKNDILMSPDGCPLYLAELDKVHSSEEIQADVDEFIPFMKNLTLWTRKKIETPNDMYNLYHTLMAESSWNLELPEWTSDIFPHGKLWEGTVLEYKIQNYNTNLRRLFGGMLLNNITDAMHAKIQGDPEVKEKMYLFSGHETNVASFLNTLGVYQPHVPEYTSAVIVELLCDEKNEYYVKLRHYLGIPSTMELLRIPGCDVNCPFETFMKLLQNVMPQDADMICPR